ncbi:hypothetical protein FB45DRAFT_417608 [Roridomyces roridus]|uniref:Uncharacterized protein n=1 Tax=Roridomyces roridus TaxID=1738132 RepID=A0AAD7FTZ6_9AGAR|nr:hypothetical protein FB45DRAFT_417608 [Roridomyces roridus]
MSFMSRRSASPPPRSPSPDVVLQSLPPPRRPVRRPGHLSLEGGSAPPRIQRPLLSMRSCTELRVKSPSRSSRSVVSAPPTPSASSGPGSRRTHKRTLSFAIPYRSPPASPTLSTPPPPVPPIPDFVLTPTDRKPVLHPVPTTRTIGAPIYLPDWEQFTVVPDIAPPTPRKQPRATLSTRRTPPAGMTCSGYFALHNSNQRSPRVVAL